MGKAWKRQWLRNKLEQTAAAATEEATIKVPASTPDPEPETIIKEEKVEKPKKAKSSSKGYRKKKITSTKKKANK